jgi:hypothetical protein
MGRAERRVEYQRKIEATEAELLSLGNRLGYAGPAVWLGMGIVAVGLAENQIMGAALGAMLGIGAFAWRSGLKQECDRLSCRRETLMAALKSVADDD